MQRVTEAYKQLWHYTTAGGLHGILSGQQLWASHFSYLSDGEELSGFFDRRLPQITKKAYQETIAEFRKTAQGLTTMEAVGGPEAIMDWCLGLSANIKDVTLRLHAYVASFCYTPERDAEEGLLSQWRGYGSDGGYAIVFDTKGLDELLADEQRRFLFAFGHMGDVDYYDDQPGAFAHEEMLEWEAAVRKVIMDSVLKHPNPNFAEPLFVPLLSLATRHKHRGFREEREVRISVITPTDEVIAAERKAGNHKPEKNVYFTLRNGTLVPHISLFEPSAGGAAAQLPIQKIIVGPHPDKLKRKAAVELLLDQLKIKAEVVASDIPYLG